MGLHCLHTSECLMYDSQACVTCIHEFFTLWACAALSHLAYNLWAHGTLYIKPHICLVYNSWACIALIHIFIYLFYGLALPSVVLHTTYGPALPLYHEHI